MKIKDLRNGRIETVTYKQWKDEYIDKGTYSNYEITDYFSVVEIHRLKSDGSRSMTFMEKTQADETKRQFPNEFEIKQLTFNGYDKWLVIEERQKGQSFLKRLRLSLLEIIRPTDTPKKKAEPIKRSTLIGIVISIIMLLLYLIVEWESISLFFTKNYNLIFNQN